MANVIWAGPADGSTVKPLTVEALASEAILPGSYVDFAAGEFAYNADAGGEGIVLVAREVGENFGLTIDEPWPINNSMVAVQPRSGEFVYVRLAAAQTVGFNTALTSNGDGTFKVAGAGDSQDLYAREAVTTAAGNVTTRVLTVKA